jgi:hypothetical protein
MILVLVKAVYKLFGRITVRSCGRVSAKSKSVAGLVFAAPTPTTGIIWWFLRQRQRGEN